MEAQMTHSNQSNPKQKEQCWRRGKKEKKNKAGSITISDFKHTIEP
jgi:hypothetical protein